MSRRALVRFPSGWIAAGGADVGPGRGGPRPDVRGDFLRSRRRDERRARDASPNYPLQAGLRRDDGAPPPLGRAGEDRVEGEEGLRSGRRWGPSLFVSLKPGSYNVSATYRGVTKKAGVICRRQWFKTVLFTWKIEETVRRGK